MLPAESAIRNIGEKAAAPRNEPRSSRQPSDMITSCSSENTSHRHRPTNFANLHLRFHGALDMLLGDLRQGRLRGQTAIIVRLAQGKQVAMRESSDRIPRKTPASLYDSTLKSLIAYLCSLIPLPPAHGRAATTDIAAVEIPAKLIQAKAARGTLKTSRVWCSAMGL